MQIEMFKSLTIIFFGCIINTIVSIGLTAKVPPTKVDLVIFSFDRPLQCHALLESIETYVTGINQIYILYRVSSADFDKAYDLCLKHFTRLNIHAVKQGAAPREDFKPNTLKILHQCANPYVVFAVDDIIVKSYVNLSECVGYLMQNNAHGFHLRLGKNISYSYTANQPCPLRSYKQLNDKVIMWNFNDNEGEWKYPHSVDMTIYSRQEVLTALSQLVFTSPNTLEAAWARHAASNGYLTKSALCYTESKILNVPLNLIQQDWLTSANMGYSSQELLNLFLLGYRIKIDSYSSIVNTAPHIEIKPCLQKKSL